MESVLPAQICQGKCVYIYVIFYLFCVYFLFLFLFFLNRAFREVCHYIGNSVEEKYKRAKCVTVGAFVFLRFFNPAIVSPDSENLCKPIENQKIRRALL